MAETNTATNAVALGLLKASLGFFDSTLDPNVEDYLNSLIGFAERALTEECKIMLTPGDIYDDTLIAMYADWLYRKRASGVGKPEMLREAIRNRQTRDVLVSAGG